MKKFSEIYKEKVNESQIQQENKVLESFKKVYSALLDNYRITSLYDLDADSQVSFLTELNQYWNENEGLLEKGEKFLDKRVISLNENSTVVQKKNFLKEKTIAIINETLRQVDFKDKIYSVLDEMYHQIKATDIGEVLPPHIITDIVKENFHSSIDKFVRDINEELTNSIKPKRKYIVKVRTKI
jgi:hypothetical protein